MRKAMSEFFDGAGLGASETIEDQTMLDSLSEGADSIIGKRGTCESRGFPNARAVGEAVNPSKKR